MNPLNDIIFEKINDTYCYGKYGDFRVVMIRKNGYINATKMCQYISEQTGSKKPFFHWNQNINSAELINAVSSDLGIPRSELIVAVSTGSKKLTIVRGTYVHPDLIPHIAIWASPTFAVKVSYIVNKYLNHKELKKKEKQLRKKDETINECKSEISNLKEELKLQYNGMMAKISEQSDTIKDISRTNNEIKHANKKLSRKMTVVKEQNDELLEHVADMQQKLETVSEDRVIKSDDTTNMQSFVVLRDDTIEDDHDPHKYYVIRTKQRTLEITIKQFKNGHTDTSKILEIEYNPNAINLWDRIKEQMKHDIAYRGNYFGLKHDMTEARLIARISEINDDKLDV